MSPPGIPGSVAAQAVDNPSSPSRSASRMGVSQSGQLPPKPSPLLNVAFWAAALADVHLAAGAALVDRVSDQDFAALKVSAEGGEVHTGVRTMPKAKSALFAPIVAIASAHRPPWLSAEQAAVRTVTRSVTHGDLAGARHAWLSRNRCLGESAEPLREASRMR